MNLDSPSSEVACAACETLGKMGLMAASGGVLVKMLRNPNQRFSALVTLRQMGYQAPVEALGAVIEECLTDADSSLREQAVAIIGNLPEAAMRQPYLGMLKSTLSSST